MVIFWGDLHHEKLHEDNSKSLIFCPNEKITTYRLGLLLFLGELFLLNPQNSTDGSQSLFFHETSMKSDLLHSASAIIPFPARWHQVSPAGLLLILNLLRNQQVCVFVRPLVWVCSFVHLLLSPVGILQRRHGKRLRDCCWIFTKDVHLFSFWSI